MPDLCWLRPAPSRRCRTRVHPMRGDRRAPWSVRRGDCRFDEGHPGPCKPGRSR